MSRASSLSKRKENKNCSYPKHPITILREVTVKIRLKRIDIQKEVIVEVLLDSRVTELTMSLEFVRKQVFKLKKIEKPIYMRNVNCFFNKKRSIKYTVGVNIYYQRYRKRT